MSYFSISRSDLTEPLSVAHSKQTYAKPKTGERGNGSN